MDRRTTRLLELLEAAKNSYCDKTQKVTKLKNSICDKTNKTQNVMKLKTQNVTKLKTENVIKLKNWKYDKTQ